MPAKLSSIQVHRLFGGVAIVHSAVILGLWLEAHGSDSFLIPPFLWVLLAWLWFGWPILLALHRGRSLWRVMLPVLIGLVMLAPCLLTLLTFTAWSISNFAP